MRRFALDAARWVVPSHFADPSTLNFRSILSLLLRHPPLRALAWYRLACWFQARSIPGLYGLLSRWIFFRFGLEIWGEIEGGLYLPHPMGCVIAVQRMGRNCSVIASVTIGMREDYAFPVIGDHVFVGAGRASSAESQWAIGPRLEPMLWFCLMCLPMVRPLAFRHVSSGSTRSHPYPLLNTMGTLRFEQCHESFAKPTATMDCIVFCVANHIRLQPHNRHGRSAGGICPPDTDRSHIAF